MSGNYYLIDKRVLPDVYEKVVNAKKLLREGKVKEVTEATKMVGISRSVYYKYKDFFIKDKKVFIKGYLKTYSDKNNNIQSYIMVTKITDKPNELINEKSAPHIRYDEDGVMVWNGKRCETIPPTEEEKKEMKKLLSEYS